MTSHFFWNGAPVAFQRGETIAAALFRAGIADLGRSADAAGGRVFCGIGACQGCVVAVAGAGPVEACLTLASEGLHLGALPEIGADHA